MSSASRTDLLPSTRVTVYGRPGRVQYTAPDGAIAVRLHGEKRVDYYSPCQVVRSNAPSIKQMANRCDAVHRRLLKMIVAGQSIAQAHSASSAGALRGVSTAMRTLHRWGCIATTEAGPVITDSGMALLTATADMDPCQVVAL